MLEYVDKEKMVYVNLFYDLSKCYPEHKLAPEVEILAYMEMLRKEPIYRIEIKGEGVITDCYDLMENINPELKKAYETIDELPKWVQDKLAVLTMLDHTKANKEIPSIGRRISKNVYWVYTRDNGEQLDGNNP